MGVCDEAAKTLGRLGLTPKQRKDAPSACRPWLHLTECRDVAGTFQRVSAKGLASRSSWSGCSPCGERRLPVPWEREDIVVTEGDEAGRRSRLTSKSGFHTGVKVSLGLAEHVRGGQRSREVGVGPEGSPGVGPGPSDGQRTPHAGPVLGVLQAAGRRAPRALCVPTADDVVVSLPGACRTESKVTGAGPSARCRWRLRQGSPGARQDACAACSSCPCVCRPPRVGEGVPPGAGDRSCPPPPGLGSHGH